MKDKRNNVCFCTQQSKNHIKIFGNIFTKYSFAFSCLVVYVLMKTSKLNKFLLVLKVHKIMNETICKVQQMAKISFCHQSSTKTSEVPPPAAANSVIRKSVDQTNTFHSILNKQKTHLSFDHGCAISFRIQSWAQFYTFTHSKCKVCVWEREKLNWTCACNRLWCEYHVNQFWVVQKAILSILCINDSISSGILFEFSQCYRFANIWTLKFATNCFIFIYTFSYSTICCVVGLSILCTKLTSS